MSRERAEDLLAQIREDWPDLLPVEVPAPDQGPMPPIQRPSVPVTPALVPAWPRPPVMGQPTLWGQPQIAPWQPLPPRQAPPRMILPQVAPLLARPFLASSPGLPLAPPPLLGPSASQCIGPYNCHLCGKEYVRRGTLEQHVERVHWGRRFQCTTCDRRCIRRADIIRHLDETGHEEFRLVFLHRTEVENLETQAGAQLPKPQQ